MHFYYGDCSNYPIHSEKTISDRERALCLCLISHLYPEMHSICLRFSSEEDDNEDLGGTLSSKQSSISPKHAFHSSLFD